MSGCAAWRSFPGLRLESMNGYHQKEEAAGAVRSDICGIMKMTDGHIHLERGDYSIEWVQQFVDRAVETQVDEIWLLEHNYMFREFAPMYESVCAHSQFVNDWFHRKACLKDYQEYLELTEKVREKEFPVKIRFGLEICYFPEFEDLIVEQTKDKGFDFLLGSIHFVDGFAFDHTAKLWEGVDVDETYRRYFEESVLLARSRIFDGIGHPDSIKLFGHKPSYPLADYYEKLAGALSDSGMYADQNSGAERRCPGTAPLGMDAGLIRALISHHVRIVTSSDAHCPEDVGYRIRELNDMIQSVSHPADTGLSDLLTTVSSIKQRKEI